MILVTGAGGTVGSALLATLGAHGVRPRAAFHNADKVARARESGQDAVAIDMMQPASLAPAMDGVDTVFLLGSGGRGQADAETNVLTAAKAAGARRIVKLSVIGAPDEQFGFARIHRQVEQAIEASGLAWTFLRPNGFMQNFANFMAPTIIQQRSIFTTIPDTRISHIDARDIADVAAAVLTSDGHEGKAYTLTGPAALTYRDAAATIGRVLGTPVSAVAISERDARAAMAGAGMPDFYIDLLVDLDHFYASGDVATTTPAVREITGREPRSFEQFVGDHAAAFRA